MNILLQVLILIYFCSFTIADDNSTSTHFKILHLTDTHGWINGHLHQPDLDADFGDLYSFISHLKNYADKSKYSEFLVLDTGDLIEGTGLSDATPIHGQDISPIAQQIPYDAMTVGNHDLGHDDSVNLMEETIIKSLGQRYVTTNTFNSDTNRHLGSCYYNIELNSGYNILIFGFIYNFDQNTDNTAIVYMEQVVQSDCFKDALENDDIDMIISLNHIDPQSQNDTLRIQYDAIRKKHEDIPFIMLTGHRHVLYYEQYDDQCFTLESGKYFEVMGIIEFDLQRNKKGEAYWTNLNTRYLNTTLKLMYEETHTTQDTFDTEIGLSISKQVDQYYTDLGLNKIIGCNATALSPYVPLNNSNSFYDQYINHIVASNFNPKDNELGMISYFVTNTAALRDYLYGGTVVLNDMYTICPFNDSYYAIANISGDQLQNLHDILNNARPTHHHNHTAHKEIINNYMYPEIFDIYHDKVIYRHQCNDPNNPFISAPEPANTTNYFFSNIEIEHDKNYMLISAEYDSYVISLALASLYPDIKFEPKIYNGKYGYITSTALLVHWIEDTFPCNKKLSINEKFDFITNKQNMIKYS